jgi:NAD-dependent dihydropyrimidine dehydrogenase PreA subunit
MISETGRPVLDAARCSGCGRCVSACPEKLFSLETAGYRKQAVITEIEQCVLCGACIQVCPVEALTTETEKQDD